MSVCETSRCKYKANHLYCTDLCCCGAEEDSCKILPVINVLMLLNNYFHVDSDISLAVSTRMPYCPILTFEDDLSISMRKINQIVTVSIARAVEVPWVTCRGLSLFPYHELLSRLF